MKKALISGITGQDGSYLAKWLLFMGYEVHGIDRRVAVENARHRYSRINDIFDKITLHSGTVQNYARMYEIINEVKPDEIYHLAAQSFVGTSFEDEFSVIDINEVGTVNVLNIMRKIVPESRFYFAGSSEMFGKVVETPQNELTPFRPRSPYGISKCAGYYYTKLYREAYDMFCCSGMLFNHESEKRGLEFVTRKITNTVARIKLGKAVELRLGNLDARRDWGYSPDYVEAMWLMLQQEKPDDYVIATGDTHSVREFCDIAFSSVGLNYKDYVIVDPKFYRPCEVDVLTGDATKAKEKLGWVPTTSFKELVSRMVEHDLEYEKEKE